MAPLRTSLLAFGLWLLQAGGAHARAQGYTGGDHPYQKDPIWDENFTFGVNHPISEDGHHIKNFIIVGEPHILSDRVTLTPPHPGNQRAAIWSDHSNHNEEWELHIPFRASGLERAGGSLTVWYTLRGSHAGTDSIYTAKPFDGLALAIDSSGGRGYIRGYLNDGNTDYSIHHHPQSLAFGQCDVSYRNLGRPTDLKVSYKPDRGLRVEFDNHICFESDKVSLPTDYRFGVTASSAENPDSFEIFGFKVGVEKLFDRRDQPQKNDLSYHRRAQEEAESRKRRYENYEHHKQGEPEKYEYKDEDIKEFKTDAQQFNDLHLRLQALTHQIAEVQRLTGELTYNMDNVVQKLTDLEHRRPGGISDNAAGVVRSIEDKLHGIDQTIQNFEKSLRHEGFKIDQVHGAIKSHHENFPAHLAEAVSTHGPRMGFSISLLIVFQVMLVIAYIMYKRRRNMAPKKYL